MSMKKIIEQEKSIIPACNVPLDLYETIVRDTADLKGVGAYYVGFELGLTNGLQRVVELTRKYTSKPIIYDHQKAATDIPDMGKNFARTVKSAGIDAVILFPQSGPTTEKVWIEAAFEQDLGVIVGGLMTHQKYLRSERGYIADEAVMEMYLNAVELGVSDFVVPGNKPLEIKKIREILEQKIVSPIFYLPGFVAQGGSISDLSPVAGNNWHAIIGRGIYQAENIRETVLGYTGML